MHHACKRMAAQHAEGIHRAATLATTCVLLAACATTVPLKHAAPSLSGIARYEPVSRPDEARYRRSRGIRSCIRNRNSFRFASTRGDP